MMVIHNGQPSRITENEDEDYVPLSLEEVETSLQEGESLVLENQEGRSHFAQKWILSWDEEDNLLLVEFLSGDYDEYPTTRIRSWYLSDALTDIVRWATHGTDLPLKVRQVYHRKVETWELVEVEEEPESASH